MKMKRSRKKEPSREKGANEIWVTYGQTRSTGKEFEFDRLEVGFARDLTPGEDRKEAMVDELDDLRSFVEAYMRGDI